MEKHRWTMIHPTLPSVETYEDGGEYNLSDDTYTNNGLFGVIVYSDDISINGEGQTNLRRVRVKFFDTEDKQLVDLYLDYARPGMNEVPF